MFYPPEHRVQKLIEPKSKIEVTLKLVTPDAGGWLDRVLSDPPAPLTLGLEVPDFLRGALLAGDLARLRATPQERNADASNGGFAPQTPLRSAVGTISHDGPRFDPLMRNP